EGSVSPDVDLRELNKVIQLRQDEIILNVVNQIKLSGYGEQLDAGIIMIGGASQMNGLVDYLSEKTQLPVKRGLAKRVYINNAAELLQNPLYTQALGLLLFANENCEKKEIVVPKTEPVYAPPVTEPETEPKKEEERRKKKGKKQKDGRQTTLFGFLEKIQNFGGTVFNDEE
ncbi:MAG: cell division protein FtsA, partial [Prevotella sp.]|nr:cell division protein FtsA [Prevotella sp.]